MVTRVLQLPVVRATFRHVPFVMRTGLAIYCAFLVLVDIIANNWELIDYIGNGQTFLTPVLNVATQDDLLAQYTFPTAASPLTISNAGRFMINHTLSGIHARDGDNYILTVGDFVIKSAANDICGVLARTYPITAAANNRTTGSPLRLGVAIDQVVYARGNALSNFFGTTTTTTAPPPRQRTHAGLTAIGYIPARLESELRLTTTLTIPPAGVPTQSNVTMYRFYNRAFCTGCDPISELGLDICVVNVTYNASAQVLVVHSSQAVVGQVHKLGLMMERSGVTEGSLYVRGFCVLLVLLGYTTSQKTVRWTDGSSLDTWVKKIIYLFAPNLYRYRSNTFNFSHFVFNSDWFVLLYMTAVLLDEKACMVYSRSMYNWNKDTQDTWAKQKLLAMNFRWVWLNCFIVKLLKVLVNFVSATRFNGQNAVVGFFNFSSLNYVYVAGLFLIARNDFNDSGNSDLVPLWFSAQNLDGISVDLFDSTFLRNYPWLALVMLLNLLAVLALNRALHCAWWARVARNSLGRQNMFNSTSILADMNYSFVDVSGYAGQAINVPTRSLCTIQWFLTCHNLRFGLPEHPARIRAMVTRGPVVQPTRERTTSVTPVIRRYLTKEIDDDDDDDDPRDGFGQAGTTATAATTDGHGNEMYMLTQDQSGYLHLFNAKKAEIQALSLEVKILADAKYYTCLYFQDPVWTLEAQRKRANVRVTPNFNVITFNMMMMITPPNFERSSSY
ncbi:Aste57867_5849 [Aphanomyces stellatus]|uniref:Aste57867_5849 protein n=1 Tax=Aphanomyces stellatus TaxID=120398 RepID=A0A485KE12_9STRA|nr:hypothetical protein As57867_005835 [Aphanomyces stellatus]VFT82872.1 Aste57867_5849 [Aphanomyces stellatus]